MSQQEKNSKISQRSREAVQVADHQYPVPPSPGHMKGSPLDLKAPGTMKSHTSQGAMVMCELDGACLAHLEQRPYTQEILGCLLRK